MPGLFVPVRLGGRLLVDGGVLNNLPVDVVRRMGADVVIAVDVSFPPNAKLDVSNQSSPTLPLTQVPQGVETLFRTVGVMMAYLQAQKLSQARPEVLVRPMLDESITLFSGFNRAAGVIAAGEEAATAALPEIKSALKPCFRPFHSHRERETQFVGSWSASRCGK